MTRLTIFQMIKLAVGVIALSLLLPIVSLDRGGDVADTEYSEVQAEPKKRKRRKRRKRKRYDRAQRAAQKLLDEGHPAVQLTLKTSPKVRAVIYHGKEELGRAPLQLTWPKDTGPLDITVKAAGYLTVNSRLYTHRNDRVTINMFKVDEAYKLFGYKKKVKPKDTETGAEEEGE